MTGEESQNFAPSSEANEPQQSYIVPSDLLERIPIDQREEFTQKLVDFGIRISQEEHYVGPLQPSREAERWDALVPGAAKRNFDLYEKQQLKFMEAQDRLLANTEAVARHEMEMEKRQHDDFVELTRNELKNTADKVNKGQTSALIVVCLIVIGGFVMIHLGHDAGGIASLLVAAASVAGIFLNQYNRDRSKVSGSKSQPESPTTS